MLILSVDTSGRNGSIALARSSEPSLRGNDFEIIEVVPLAGGTFSAQLIPQVAALLAKHNFTKRDIEAFIVASGPGSFTGLRVGLAAIKGLAEALAKPIAAVSLLEALALAAKSQGRVIAALDAGRGEVYAGEYKVDRDTAILVTEELLSQAEVFARAKASAPLPPIFVTSDKLVAEAAKSSAISVVLVSLDAGALIFPGLRKIKAEQIVSPEALEANYIRRIDAEVLAKGS